MASGLMLYPYSLISSDAEENNGCRAFWSGGILQEHSGFPQTSGVFAAATRPLSWPGGHSHNVYLWSLVFKRVVF